MLRLAGSPGLLGGGELGGGRLQRGAGVSKPVLELGQLGPALVLSGSQLVALCRHPLAPLLERSHAIDGPGVLGVTPDGGGLGRRQLRPSGSDRGRGRLHLVAHPVAERRPILAQRRLGLGEAGRFGGEGRLVVVQLLQLGPKTSGLGLEGGHDRLVERGIALTLDAAVPLAEHRGCASGASREALTAHQEVGQVVGAGGGQAVLGDVHRGVELGELGLHRPLVNPDLAPAVLECRASDGQRGELHPGEVDAQGAELLCQAGVTPSRLGLALKGPELAASLAQQIGQAHEVALGGGQAALGLLLAAPELEHAGGLLDDGPSLLGPSLEHSFELALAHDDVLGPAHAGVAQQLLDVEQAARDLVDGVLAGAVAEQDASDGDLGEVDREHPRAVVDGQADLGAAQRWTSGGAGEDDVVHLVRAQGARTLGAEHPGDGVDHVRLAAAVGADDHGDAGLEVEGRGVGEGLEAFEGEALEVHAGPEARRATTVTRGPGGGSGGTGRRLLGHCHQTLDHPGGGTVVDRRRR